MERRRRSCGARLLVGALSAMVLSGPAIANRGGGDSGDSSMNPFTGDSYAYFHGGHNLGEQGTIRPNRVPAKPSMAQDAKPSSAPSRAPAARTAQPKTLANETAEHPAPGR